VRAVASPVFGLGGKLVGSLAVVGTFPREIAEEYGRDVAQASWEFSKSIGGVTGESSQFPRLFVKKWKE
jgi:DNA-binding IclR family transcriptional regulator